MRQLNFITLILLILAVSPIHAKTADGNHGTGKQYRYTHEAKAPLRSLHYPLLTTRERLVARAHQLIGHRYRWGGASVETGFDCSGLLVYLYRTVAQAELPRTTQSMIARYDLAISPYELQPGDAVFFSRNGNERASHVGIYIGNSQFIHAPRTGKTIRIDSLESAYWKNSYITARNFGTE